MYPSFPDLVTFVKEMAEDANDPVYGQFNVKSSPHDDSRSSKHKIPSQVSALAANVKTSSSKKITCVVCGLDHQLIFCPDFERMTVEERRKIVVNNKLCKSPYVCTVPNCNKGIQSLFMLMI